MRRSVRRVFMPCYQLKSEGISLPFVKLLTGAVSRCLDCLLRCLFFSSFIHFCVRLFVCSCVHSLTRSVTYSFIHYFQFKTFTYGALSIPRRGSTEKYYGLFFSERVFKLVFQLSITYRFLQFADLNFDIIRLGTYGVKDRTKRRKVHNLIRKDTSNEYIFFMQEIHSIKKNEII